MSPEVVANGNGQTEITPMHGIKDRDEPHGETASSLQDSPNNHGTSMLADPRIANYIDGTTPIKSKIKLSCEECTYKTNDLPWKTAKKRMRDDKRKHHCKDHNDTEALIEDLAKDTKQNPNTNKGPNTIRNSDSETSTSKTTG